MDVVPYGDNIYIGKIIYSHMNLEILREIGLTKNEIKIFLALLKSGPSSATRIAKEAEVHRSKVYDSLKRIISKGIVHYKVQDNKQIFIANSPEELLTVIKEKREKLDREEEKIKEIIPELHGISNTNKEEQSSNVMKVLRE